MAVTVLILAVEQRQDPNSDSELALRYRKGSILVARPDSWQWGTQEGLPNFIRVTVSDATYQQAAAFVVPWLRRTTWSVVSSDTVTDKYTIKLSNSVLRADGLGGFSEGEVNAFVASWNGTNVQRLATGEVTFDVLISSALQSNGFWNRDVSSVSFHEDAYNQSTGQHTITATIPTAINFNQAINEIIARGGDILTSSLSARTIQYQMVRDDASNQFRDYIQNKTATLVSRARYYISAANVDAIVAAGGTITRTKAQFLAALLDNAA